MTLIQQPAVIGSTERIGALKERMLDEPRYLSIEQALIITDVYQAHEGGSAARKRALSLAEAMRHLAIHIDPDELIVGNRTTGVRGGVVFPEAGISWIDRELDTMATRPQDKFNVHPEDAATFRERILPYWQGKTLEDTLRAEDGPLLDAIARVVKINQKDHAQGHICPDTAKWIHAGAAGIRAEAVAKAASATADQREFYDAVLLVLDASMDFMRRYADLATDMAANADTPERAANLHEIARICNKLSLGGAETFHEAVQSLWFLFTLLHMESNASSFSPGRADQYLYPYYLADVEAGRLDRAGALELIEALWLKFNQIVYLRNSHSASFFAGFPIGFNVAFGGRDEAGRDESNELSYLFLEAQAHILLPQPNLSARLHANTPGRAPRRVHAGDRARLGDAAGLQRRVDHPRARGAGHRPGRCRQLCDRRLRRAHDPRQQPWLVGRGHVQPGQGARACAERRHVPPDRGAARPADGLSHRLRDLRGPRAGLRRPDRLLLREDDRGVREGRGDPPAAPPVGAPLVGHRRLPRPRPRRHPRRRALQPVRHPGHPGGQRRRQPGRGQEAGLRRAHGGQGPARRRAADELRA